MTAGRNPCGFFLRADPMVKSLQERFEEKYIPEPNSGCWLWMGAIALSRGGKQYGLLHCDGRLQMAHRISYEMEVLPIPSGLVIDHKCRNTLCVNPYHLEPVTSKENTRRGTVAEAARQTQLSKTHCPQGHPFAGDNLYVKPNGRRECRACVRASGRRYKARKAKCAAC